jgi:hypothetical protein
LRRRRVLLRPLAILLCRCGGVAGDDDDDDDDDDSGEVWSNFASRL